MNLHSDSRKSRQVRRMLLETLESRACPAVYVPSIFSDELDADTSPGDLSLREAVNLANANPGADQIQLAAGTYLLSLAGAGENASLTGDLDVLGDLTVVGAVPGRRQSTRPIWGSGSSRSIPAVPSKCRGSCAFRT